MHARYNHKTGIYVFAYITALHIVVIVMYENALHMHTYMQVIHVDRCIISGMLIIFNSTLIAYRKM